MGPVQSKACPFHFFEEIGHCHENLLFLSIVKGNALSTAAAIRLQENSYIFYILVTAGVLLVTF